MHIHMTMTDVLHAERQRRHPPLECACASLRRAARAVTQLYDEELRSTGLRVTQYTLLHALGTAGELVQGRLGELLALDTTTLSRTLRVIERSGWIESVPGRDRRERNWRLTPAGHAKWDEARPHWSRAQERLRATLGDDAWDDIVGASNVATWAAKT
jgi:DNA-binding MarR family transcriptional regulator